MLENIEIAVLQNFIKKIKKNFFFKVINCFKFIIFKCNFKKETTFFKIEKLIF